MENLRLPLFVQLLVPLDIGCNGKWICLV